MQEHTLSHRENYRLSIYAQKQMQLRNEAILMDLSCSHLCLKIYLEQW